MKNRTAVIVTIALVLVIGVVGVIALTGNKSDNTSDTTASNNSMGNMDMGNTSQSGSGSASSAVTADSVDIENYAFSPQVIKVKVGQKVTWTNKDSVRHDVISDSGEELSGPLLAKGESYSHTFTKAGTYTYHCQPHPYMKATVIVEE